MKKRIFCLFLSLVMVFSLLPVTALAADVPGTTEYVSGGCTVSFTDEDGDGNYTATVKAIEGDTGKMATYAIYDSKTEPDTVAPWIKDGWNEFTTKIVIDDSVAALSGHAFETFSATKEIVFPENPKFTSIPSNFMMINGLEELTIPEGITSVGNFAFSQRSITTGAITLKRVVLPSTLQVPEPNTVNGTNGNQAFTYWNSPVATGSIADLNEAQKAIFPMTTVVTSTAAQVAWAESLGYTVEHTYGEPTYEWSEGYGTCTATVTCTRGDGATITENATVTSAGSVHTATFTDSRFATQTVDSSKSMKVLFFGNSYTEDATNNSPMATSKTWEALAALCGENVDPKNVVVGAMTSGGKSMAWHALQAKNNAESYTLRVCEGTDTWKNVSDVKTVDAALKYTNWDFVILQPYTNESHGGNDGSAQGDDQGSQNQNYVAAQTFKSLNDSCTELLNHIQTNARNAKTYLYMLWQHNSGDNTDAASTDTGYRTIVSTITTAANYKSSDGTYGFAGYVPVGTAIQNARTTYLADLRFNVGETVNLANDPVKGMERDSHLTFNIGRYIAGLTFAETLANAKGYTWSENDIPALRVSEAIGKLPDQYWEIAKASVVEAIATPDATTTISGYETDPAVAAKEDIEKIDYRDIAVTTASEVKTAVTEKINALTLPAGVKVGTVTVTSVQPAINTFSATVPVTYGYTTATAMPYAGKQMSYESGGCMVTFSDDDGDGNYTATVTAIQDGNGVMDNYNVANGGQTLGADQTGKDLPPWLYEWKDYTTKLVIDSSVKGLGGNAFEYMYKIEEVVFPENPQFTYIPGNFMMVNSLKEVTIPEGITSIGPFAFSQRDFKESALTLKKVTLPTSLTSVATTYTRDKNLNQAFTYWNGAGDKTAAEYAASMPYLFSSTTIVPATAAQLTWAEAMGYTVEHVYGEIQYNWTNDFSQCTATLPCTTGDGYKVTETASSTKVGATYTVTFENPLLGSTSISAGTKLPAGLQLVGGTAGNTDYSATKPVVDGTGGNPSVVLEYVAATDVEADVKTDVETAAETFLSADEKVLAVVEANLYINNGGTLTRVSNAELNENIEVLVPYAQAVVGKSYILYHYNGTGFDDSIAAEGVMVGGVKYLKFQYNKFSPFVIVGGVGYNAITATTGEGYTVTYSGMGKTGEDYTFTVTVDSGYTLQSVKANGNAFTATDPTYVKVNDSTYTIKNLNDNYKIEVKVTKDAYSVTYNKNVTGVASVTGMPDSISGIADGSSYIISNAEPSRAGYTFKGWALTAGATVADDTYAPGKTITVNADVTLYAVWQQDMVTITYPADVTGADVSKTTNTTVTENVTEGSTQTFTVTVTAGYDPATMKVTANGKELSATAVSGSTYTYKFVADVDTVIDVVAPSKLKYTITLPTGEHFTAKFTAPSDAVGKGSYTFNYGATDAKFSVQLKDGYTGTVYIDGEAQTAIAKDGTATYALHSTGGITHVCDIRVETTKVQTFTVTYTIDGQTYTTRTVDKGTLIKDLSDIDVPAKTGYNFDAWYSNTDLTTALGSATGTVDGDMEVYGKWKPVQGTIKYDLKSGSGSFANQTKVYGEALQLRAAIPTRTGYTFKGWATVEDGVAVYQPGDMYATEIGTSTVTLYAVWEQITFTVTLPSGTGYSISTEQSTTVNYNGSFTFTVKVDRGYATAEPTVKANTTELPNGTAADSGDGGKTYTYTISNITADQAVSVSVTENQTYTVTFYTWKNDGNTTEVYLTQQVEDTYKATQPANPVIEGYTFEGWYTVKSGSDFALGTGTADKALDTPYNFDNAVTGNLVVVAKMVPIKPEVTIPANVTSNGWTIDFDTTKDTTGTGTGRIHTHPYNTDCIFTVTIAEGYDASNMQVGANGVALAPTKIDGNVYTYVVSGVKVDTTITVVGVVRKTVTITYNANAGDDVSEMPEQQVVNYYLSGASGNSKITTQIPTRVGYEFKGWSTKSDLVPDDYDVSEFDTEYHYYAKGAETPGTDTILHTAGVISRETKDTTLYAIWKANATTIDLTVSDVAVAAVGGTNAKEYEGQKVTLTATLNTAVSTGSVIFYQNDQVIDSQKANGSTKYTFKATTGAYSGTDTYKVEYKAESAEGYSDSTSGTVSVDRLSTTITWKLTTSDAVEGTAAYYYSSTIKITEGTTALTPGTAMTAGKTYTLTAPAVYELGTTTALTVGTDYTITWQYLDGANGWKTLAENQTTSTFQVTSKYSKYQFRALMVVNTGDSTVYTKAAKFADEYMGDLNTTETMGWLISEPTPAVEKQKTTTDLDITGADNEDDDVVINGATPFTTIGDHKAQFEGQTVTLTATVKETSTGTPAVASGSVEFYQNGTLIATVPVETAGTNMGKASFEATMNAFTGTDATTNKDVFTAKYVKNATYDESTSTPSEVYIKSTAIQTPVINSALSGKRGSVTGATSTSYTEDLTGLLAGVKHTFTLKTTGANTTETADWSVVALDGRTVASTDYTIQWLVTTGTNEEKAANNETAATFVVNESKSGDKYRVKLVPTADGDMKTGATSKYAKIGTKQDVNVTVTASDEITSTEVDRANGKYPDVYQLNEIKLTATVAAAQGANATVKPSGTVAFYYQDGTSWVYLGEAVLTKDTDGQMRASIDTTKLPVTDTTNVKRDVKITAVYLGDNTFNVSRNYNETTREVSAGTTTNGVTDETVTVYSSVVLVHAAEENKAVTSLTDGGIHISAEDGKVLANETRVNLKLSDVYTLDHNPTLALSKLAYGVDYTVQWQQLSNAASYTGAYAADTTPWVNIDGATGVTCQIDVEDGAAYRAMITVNNTPIAKGSYTFVDQDINGRQVYYSNILVAADAPATVTVNVNTSNTADGYEGIVEGEKVTIHTYASGASGTTPISELTVTVTKNGAVEPTFKQVKTNVNGHVSFDWTAADPGYYTLTVNAKFTNGYDNKTITRTLIVRDDNYDFTVSNTNPTYNGKVQGLTVTVDNMGIESDLAQKSVVVYYYTDANRTQQVEPTQAGTYYATIRLQESAYWTEKTMDTTFTIKQREVEIDDVIVQAKVYNGNATANVQEIILKDAVTDQTGTGLPTGNTGVINGDSVYAIGTAVTNSANVNEANSVTVTVTLPLLGDDAANYNLVDATYTEAFTIQRSQVKGDIADSTFKYTGSNITVPADDIYLIDQAGNVITPANYTVTYYYHNGDGVEKVTAMNKLGKYTVIARPEQTNYKGGASETIYVVSGNGTDEDPTKPTSLTIDITDTVVLYTGTQVGVTAKDSKGNTITDITYNGSTAIPTAAGRYLVKVTASTGDTAYGIYTIVKANPVLKLKATGAEYTSAQISGTPTGTFNGAAFPVGTYYTYTGGTIQGVAYEAPTEVGTYIVTAHVPETDNYTAHEISYQFVITPKALKITADSLQRRQYGAFPDMTASFDGLATGGVAADTSLRDVQIQPELIFNAAYSNDAMDQVGSYTITAVAALARNYEVSYVTGLMTVTADEPNPYLAIHGMIDNGNGGDIAYYGDVIQLYAYGSQMGKVINNSSVLTWSSSDNTKFPVTQDGLLTINGVGTFTVTLTRGVGAQKITTSITITALKQEVKVVVPELNTVYDATSQDYTTTKTMSAVNAKGVQVFEGNSRFVISGNIRTDVGSQIVTGKVADSIQSFQSETYGGLFTINDKEATVAPGAQETVYGTKETYDDVTYVVTGKAGSVDPITDVMVASVADAYANLDVLDGYEILVAGVENKNYNVKYITDVTDGSTPDAQVTAKTLTVSTGTLNNNIALTSGSRNPLGDYPVNGAEVNASAALGAANVRMYGEPNWVMDYALATLVDGDSLADLATLPEWLVKFDYTKLHNIAEDANLQYPTPQNLMTSKSNYSIDSSMSFGNYTVSKDNGTQNIYQRPVTLKLANGIDKLDVLFSDVDSLTVDRRTAYLRDLIVANLNVLKYTEAGQEVGGLATLLKHTANDLDYELTYTYNASGFDVTIKAINNYWSENYTIHVNVVKEKYKVVYNSFTATSATVTLYHVDLDTGAETAEFLPSGNLMCKIFTRTEDGSYLGETPVVNVAMQRTSTPGVYTVTYPRLVGSYRMFAIAEGGVGYTIVNGIK